MRTGRKILVYLGAALLIGCESILVQEQQAMENSFLSFKNCTELYCKSVGTTNRDIQLALIYYPVWCDIEKLVLRDTISKIFPTENEISNALGNYEEKATEACMAGYTQGRQEICDSYIKVIQMSEQENKNAEIEQAEYQNRCTTK